MKKIMICLALAFGALTSKAQVTWDVNLDSLAGGANDYWTGKKLFEVRGTPNGYNGIYGPSYTGIYTDEVRVRRFDKFHADSLGYGKFVTVLDDSGRIGTSYISSLPFYKLGSLSTVASTGAYSDLGGKPTDLSSFTNGPGYLTSVSNSQIIAALGYTPVTNTRTLTINGVAQNLSADRTFNVGTVTSIGVASTDFSVSGSPVTTSGSITLNLNTSGVTAGTYEFITVNSKGIVTGGYNSATNLIASRTFGTAYQASSTTRIFDVDFTVNITIGGALLSSSSGYIALEISANGTSGWTEYARVTNGNGGVASATNSQTSYIEAKDIPAGYYYRLNSVNTANATFTYLQGHETLKR